MAIICLCDVFNYTDYTVFTKSSQTIVFTEKMLILLKINYFLHTLQNYNIYLYMKQQYTIYSGFAKKK